jgi:hypothetical protein
VAANASICPLWREPDWRCPEFFAGGEAIADIVSGAAPGSRHWSPTRVTVLFVVGIGVVLSGLYGVGRIVKAAEGPGPLADLAVRAECREFQADGIGFADAHTGHCTIDAQSVTLATFDSDRDRDGWVSARLTFGRLAVGGPDVWIVQGDRWAIETSSRALCRRIADKLNGTIAV